MASNSHDLQLADDNTWKPSRMTVTEFQAAVEEAFKNHFKPDMKLRYYGKVRVLLFCWEADNSMDQGLKLGNRIGRLSDIFRKSYNYDVKELILRYNDNPPYGGHHTLAKTIREATADLGKDDLFILFYIGHGAQGSANNNQPRWLFLHPTNIDGLPSSNLNFNMIYEEYLKAIDPDVLVLLDCCAASGAVPAEGKELIAASAFDKPAHDGPNCFTNILIQQLEHAVNTKTVLTTPQLYAELAMKAIIDEHGEPVLKTMPYHIQRYRTHRMPIYLAPMLSLKDCQDWHGGYPDSVWRQPVNVLLNVHLRDGNQYTRRELEDWLLKSRPISADRVSILQVYPSLSAIVLFKVTVDMWYSLHGHPSINFVGFERNLQARKQPAQPQSRGGPVSGSPSGGLSGGLSGVQGSSGRPSHGRGPSSGAPYGGPSGSPSHGRGPSSGAPSGRRPSEAGDSSTRPPSWGKKENEPFNSPSGRK